MLWSDKMGKELTFTMSQQIIDMASKPLRKREDAILLLLYTIRMFDFHEIFMRFVAYRLLKNSLQHTLFQIGEPVIKYKESGSIMDWIKYIKENKRKRK